MSFFGFDTALPRDREHNASRPGFSAPRDPFAGLSGRQGLHDDDDDDAIDFEDTYDGLGDQLDESADVNNADTFGVAAPADRNFDFSGQTSMLATAMRDDHPQPAAPPAQLQQQQQQQQYNQPQSFQRSDFRNRDAKPAVSGYEKYHQPNHIPDLVASASIWGTPTPEKKPELPAPQAPSISAATRKMMSLEEIEASMRAQRAKPAAPSPAPQPQQTRDIPQQTFHDAPIPMQSPPPVVAPGQQVWDHGAPQLLQKQQQPPQQPGPPRFPQVPDIATAHQHGPSYAGQNLARFDQFAGAPQQPTTHQLEDEAKRAKRNQKIRILSRDNGLMTPQDKNFITRIQLSQLMAVTGNVEESGSEAAKTEDFYYDVFCQIRAPGRAGPDQPLNQFAQAYMNQSFGRGSRRYPLGGQNQMRRMAQQVERAVEAARNRPKVSHLNIQGSLGKISFSNAKTPKPLLNLKPADPTDSTTGTPKKPKDETSLKSTLRNIEAAYDALMRMEDCERKMPPPPREGSPADQVEAHMRWRASIDDLNALLWNKLKVHAPIDPNPSAVHPFVAMLSHSKGKKLVPRVFRQLNEQQRLTVLTIIVIHLDRIDVVEQASGRASEPELPREIREQIDLFQQALSPCFFGLINEASLEIVSGFIELIVNRTNIQTVMRTKIGVSLLTMLISRAELIKQGGHASEQDVGQWAALFDSVFGQLEPLLPQMFPENSKRSGDDVYVWQFLAAMGIGASPEQQQRLVIAVKDQVMDTIGYARTLPEDMARPKLDNVNLFMTAIGLDVSMLS